MNSERCGNSIFIRFCAQVSTIVHILGGGFCNVLSISAAAGDRRIRTSLGFPPGIVRARRGVFHGSLLVKEYHRFQAGFGGGFRIVKYKTNAPKSSCIIVLRQVACRSEQGKFPRGPFLPRCPARCLTSRSTASKDHQGTSLFETNSPCSSTHSERCLLVVTGERSPPWSSHRCLYASTFADEFKSGNAERTATFAVSPGLILTDDQYPIVVGTTPHLLMRLVKSRAIQNGVVSRYFETAILLPSTQP